MFSPSKEFFRFCPFIMIIRLALVTLPAAFLVLCLLDLPEREIPTRPLRLLAYICVISTYGGPLIGVLLSSRAPIFWKVPSFFYLWGCVMDLFGSIIPKYPLMPLTPKILIKLLDDQLDDYHTALFITLVLKVVLVIAFIVGVAVATEPSHSSARVRTKKPKTKSDDTKPKDQPPKYETVINVDK